MKPKQFILIIPNISGWIVDSFFTTKQPSASIRRMLETPPKGSLSNVDHRTLRSLKPQICRHILDIGAAVEVGMEILSANPQLFQAYFDLLLGLFQDDRNPLWEVQLLDFLELKRIDPGNFYPNRGRYLLQLHRVSQTPDEGDRRMKLAGLEIDVDGWRKLRAERRTATWLGKHDEAFHLASKVVASLKDSNCNLQQVILAEELGVIIAYQSRTTQGQSAIIASPIDTTFAPAKTKIAYMRGLFSILAGLEYGIPRLVEFGKIALTQDLVLKVKMYFPEQIASVRYWLSISKFLMGDHWEAIQYLSLVTYEKSSRYFIWANILDLIFKYKLNEPDLYFEIGRVKRLSRSLDISEGLEIARFIEKNQEQNKELLLLSHTFSGAIQGFIPFHWVLTGKPKKSRKGPTDRRATSG